MSLPAGATVVGGIAVSADGAVYVTQTGAAAITSGTIQLNDGAAATPSFGYAADTTTGFWRWAAGSVAFTSQNFNLAGFTGGAAAPTLRLASGATLSWSSVDPTAQVSEAGLSRLGTNSVGVGNGTYADVSGQLSLALLAFAGGIENTITAHSGGGQASAFALSTTKAIHNVTTVGLANDSVVLPNATGSGKVHWVKNSAAANSLQLFSVSPGTIDGVATGTGVAIAAGKSRILVDIAANTWISILGA